MYDIYLNSILRKLLEVSDLIEAVPLLADSTFQSRTSSRSRVSGELGLELPEALAKRLLERFVAAGAQGYYFPSAYHQPRITLEQATLIAAQEIERNRLEQDPTDLFLKRMLWEWYPGVEEKPIEIELTADVMEAISFTQEGSCYWEFIANSVHARKKHISGVWGAFVDKLDGHIWSWEQIRCLHRGLFDW